jgi:hypothetical protein
VPAAVHVCCCATGHALWQDPRAVAQQLHATNMVAHAQMWLGLCFCGVVAAAC